MLYLHQNLNIHILNIFVGQAKNLPVDCRTSGCGKGATCSKDGAMYKCTCPTGSSGNPENECVQGKW